MLRASYCLSAGYMRVSCGQDVAFGEDLCRLKCSYFVNLVVEKEDLQDEEGSHQETIKYHAGTDGPHANISPHTLFFLGQTEVTVGRVPEDWVFPQPFDEVVFDGLVVEPLKA